MLPLLDYGAKHSVWYSAGAPHIFLEWMSPLTAPFTVEAMEIQEGDGACPVPHRKLEHMYRDMRAGAHSEKTQVS